MIYSSTNIEKIDLCIKNNILLSKHHDGFEKDFLDYILIEEPQYTLDFKYLKSAKLKNLHEYIMDSDVDITINNQNKKSILLGFVNIDEIFE